MNQHNGGFVQLEGYQATENLEGSRQTCPISQTPEDCNRLMSQHGLKSSSADTGQAEGKVVKQKAKKTSRLRLIQNLNRANGIAKAVQAAAQVPVETSGGQTQIQVDISEDLTAIQVDTSEDLAPIQVEALEDNTQIPVDPSEGQTPIHVDISEDLTAIQVDTSEGHAQIQVEASEDLAPIQVEALEDNIQIPVDPSEGHTPIHVDISEDLNPIQVEASEDLTPSQVEAPEDNTLSVNHRDLPSECSATTAKATATTAPRPKTQGTSSLPISGPQTFDPSAPPIGWDLSLRIDGKNFYLVNRVASLPSKSAEQRRRSRIEKFDPVAFDAAIYQQCAATKAPSSVQMPRSSPSSSEDQRLYLHIDPAIHYAHSRSDDWFKAKVQEIESRGGRKAWFGRAAERIRWLHSQTKREKRLANGHGLPQRRADPQPWKYNRPLDFGIVPESQLPEDVLENPNWLRYCAHFRDVERLRVLRRREAKRSEQETLEYYKTIMAKMWTSAGH